MKPLDKLQAIVDRATVGEWTVAGRTILTDHLGGDRIGEVDGGYRTSNGNNQYNDAMFIATARNVMPALIAVARAANDIRGLCLPAHYNVAGRLNRLDDALAALDKAIEG